MRAVRVVSSSMLALSIVASGCTVVTIAGSRKEAMGTVSVDLRVTGRRANLDGTLCYVERKQRVTSRTHIVKGFLPFAPIQGLVGAGVLVAGLPGSDESADSTLMGIGGVLLVDFIIAATYVFLRSDSLVNDESWVQTGETATCAP